MLDNPPAGVEHTVVMSEWTTLLDDLTAYLRWQQECGQRTEEIDPETIRTFLTDSPTRPVVARTPAAEASVPRSAPTVAVPAVPASGPDDSPEARQAALAAIAQQVAGCRICVLCEKRTQGVPGQGNPISPDVMFIGEAPGAEEDKQGLAFVGAAGQLLTRMIAAMGYTRDQIFIANICKCRPPDNRPPALDEMQSCLPFLRAQITAIRPKVIVALGATAVKGLLESSAGISRLRGTWTSYAGVPLMPTYHPAYLLRYPLAKKDAWNDLKMVLQRLGKSVPAKKRDES